MRYVTPCELCRKKWDSKDEAEPLHGSEIWLTLRLVANQNYIRLGGKFAKNANFLETPIGKVFKAKVTSAHKINMLEFGSFLLTPCQTSSTPSIELRGLWGSIRASKSPACRDYFCPPPFFSSPFSTSKKISLAVSAWRRREEKKKRNGRGKINNLANHLSGLKVIMPSRGKGITWPV